MGKTIFINDRWVKAILDGEICLGITYYRNHTHKEEKSNQLVFLITKDRKTKNLIFNDCSDIKYLQFIPSPNQLKGPNLLNGSQTIESFLDSILSPPSNQRTIKTLAKSQLNGNYKN